MLLSSTALLLVSAPPAALAAGAGPATGLNCTAEALPAGSLAAPVLTCYPTFAASVRAATGGRVSLPATATPASVSAAALNSGPRTPTTTYVLSIDYVNSSFKGNTLVWYQSSRCGSFQSSSMPSGWNDVVSSVAAFNGCATTLFWNSNFGKPTYAIHVNGSASSLGTFNDKASSQKWCTAYPCG